MNKKDYMKPAMNVVKVNTARMIAISDASTSGLGSGQELKYESTGGDQGSAWSRGNSGWDDDE